ncbi:protein pelota [Rhizoclosmatium globosum]|uniref:Protein DOM34 homolog n=1 Tax=Rhizoclosmatium globosum TaxID=329046 RepID=A0A1Y2BQP8_9FUNG|nr:protein pelota [Rhizoclosmatium globosum]|eukprot:ORY37071.1 protein pelota [Rhizoclosmatium globosum]
MKLVKKDIDAKDGSGYVTLIAEEQEDMWHAYNIVLAGDSLKGSTVRRVVSESSTGSTDKTSVRLTLTIEVESVEFDTQACMMRVNGRNIVENKFVKMGGYHTLDLEMHKPFTITKDCWDMIALDRITMACDVAARADIAAILLEEGLATLCLVTSSMTLVRGRVEVNVPRKRKGSSGHEKGMKRFFEQCFQAILKSVDFEVVKVLIVASPGFYKDQLFEYMKQQAVQTENKQFLHFLPKLLLIHCSSGQKHALGEALADPGVQSKLEDTKFATEVRALAKFFEMLSRDPDRAFYGFRHVEMAAEKGAVNTLLLSDDLFRSNDIVTRRKYIALVEHVKSLGATVMIFSSLHTSGEQLTNLTGVAAILNFPLPE